MKTASTVSFDFGHKYYYWDSFRHNEYHDYGPNAGYKKCDWYIEQKYDNIFEEMLQNDIYPLDKRCLERALQKAKGYLSCDMSKTLRSDSCELCEHCEIRPGTIINKDNLLCIILYSDYTTLCTKFSSTFRKFSDETLDEMKDRNAEFWNWSKLLTETVELYGVSICNTKIEKFYHGVSYMTFASFLSYFCGPTSTTLVLEVAHKFCGSNGLILELKKENDFSLLKYFNVAWISSYTDEVERLFIWGNKPLKFHSITLVRQKENYYHYIVALTLFDYILNGKKLTNTDKESKVYKIKHAKIINGLMKHYDESTQYKNKFPAYINDTFKTFLENKKQICIHFTAVNDYSFIRQHITSIFKQKKNKNLLLFDQIAKVFKNCKAITVWNDPKQEDGNILSLSYLKELYEILSNLNYLNNKIKLKIIKLNDVRYYDGNKLKFLNSETFIHKYGVQFPACTLKVINQTRKRNNIRTIIRSDLHIQRSLKRLNNIQELSHAISAIKKQTSDSNSHSNFSQPSSQRNSRVYNPSMTVVSIFPVPSKIASAPGTCTPSRNSPSSQNANINISNSFAMIDFSKMSTTNTKPSKSVVNTLQQIDEGVADMKKDLKTKAVSTAGSKRLSHIIVTKKSSTTSLWDNNAREIWMCSGPKNNTIKFDDLYPHLILHFRNLSNTKNRKPSRMQLEPFFKFFCQSNNVELCIHSNQFERFYLWFRSMCHIIADFRHIYDNNKVDILSSLFYNRRQAGSILTKTKKGTFLLRICEQRNKLYISCKENKGNKIHHYFFTRIGNEIYRIGNTNVSQEIFKIVRSSKQLKYLYAEKRVIQKKAYF